MDYVYNTARVDDIKDRVVEAKRTLELCITVILFSVGKELNLYKEKLTTNLVRQFITTTINEIIAPINIKVNFPSVYPSIL